MKVILIFTIQLLISGLVLAQQPGVKVPATASNSTIRICTPSRHNLLKPGPLCAIYSHNKIIALGDSVLASLDPKMIKSICVLKDSAAIKAYGSVAKNGVIEVTIDDEKYPEAYKNFRKKAEK